MSGFLTAEEIVSVEEELAKQVERVTGVMIDRMMTEEEKPALDGFKSAIYFIRRVRKLLLDL